MDSGGKERRDPDGLRRWFGVVCLAHAAAVLLFRGAEGRASECLWLCHVAEWAIAVGLLFRLPWVASAAVASILVIQSLWIVDACGWLLQGRAPLRMIYLENADLLDWFVVAPHFYAAPLSAYILARCRMARRGSWVFAAAGFLVLGAATRAWTDPELGVNAVFRPVGGMEQSVFADLYFLGVAPYLGGLFVAVALVAFWPGAVLLQLLQRAMHRDAAPSQRADSEPSASPDRALAAGR